MQNRIRVGLVQIDNSFSGQVYFPYSIGTLGAFARAHLRDAQRYEFLPLVYERAKAARAVRDLKGAQVVGFSVYVWNIRISLELARRIKSLAPDTVIVFGGPQVPDQSEGFLKRHACVDLVCHGEGERVFAFILENMERRDWRQVPSVSFLDERGGYVRTPPLERMRDLSDVPSPYLSGFFDPLVRGHPKGKWIALWETNRGCPFSCTFCDWGSAVQSKIYQFPMDRVCGELEWFARSGVEFIFCADANFGILPRDLEIARRAAQLSGEYGCPRALSVQNTKNVTENAYRVQKTLAEAGLNKGVAISLQSMDTGALGAIKRRNISVGAFQQLQQRFSREGIETYTDIILGLPGETYDSFADGVGAVIQGGQHNRIQFNNLSVLPNAEMGDEAYQKKYGLVLVEASLVNVHGFLGEGDAGVMERQQLVVATAALPKTDWVRERVFSWMTALLHFDKMLQIPFIALHELYSVGYRELVEAFSEGELSACPVLSDIRSFFKEKAEEIQRGGCEYCRSERWLGIWWPADELVFIRLCAEGLLDSFYEEAQGILEEMLSSRSPRMDLDLLRESLHLNRALLRLPFRTEKPVLALNHDIPQFYQSVLRGERIAPRKGSFLYRIDRDSDAWPTWEQWCREVVWFGNKKGAYLYRCRPVACDDRMVV